MAEVDIAPNFGAELKDGFKPVNAWVGNGIAWLDDIQQFYRERSVIEKEYSQKLSTLAKKYFEKKAKKSSSLSVGDNPTVTPGSLESASMTTWTVQLTTLEQRAAEHERFSTQLINSLAQPLQNLAERYEGLRKQHAEYAAKLEKERDGAYGDLRKTKGKYDSVCQDVESRRKKIESSYDHGKIKAQGQYQQQQSDMRNMKNTYLIAINVTNKQKERYYHEYVPELLDSLQSVSEAKTATLNQMWSIAASLETDTLQRSLQLLGHLAGEIPRNKPVLDSMMFVRHNATQWQDPLDFAFEPSPVWLDDDVMASDPSSKTFLMNILSKSKSSVGELRRECDGKSKEVEGAKRVRQAIREGRDKRDELEIVRSQLHQQELLHEAERKLITAEVEMSTITAAVGDVTVGARNHAMRNETFRLPTNCDLCGDRIWGLSAKGLICNDCGYTCHLKCELKVPADCPGELTKDQKKAMKSERQAAAAQATAASPKTGESNGTDKRSSISGGGSQRGSTSGGLQRSDTMGSMNTLSSGYAASAHRSVSGTITTMRDIGDTPKISTSTPRQQRITAPPPTSPFRSNGEADDGEDNPQPTGKMLYAYQATASGELSIAENQAFSLLEPDDGSGWIKIKPSRIGSAVGLVPASYAELSSSAARSPTTPNETDHRPISYAGSTSTVSLAGSDSAGSIKKKVGPAVAPPRRGAKKPPAAVKQVEALYTYAAQGSGEASMEAGERMVLVGGDQGDGWVEVQARAGRGVVPASWVREV
ncbi:Protein BZZ1 [Friedmanniomyces endolithicus]|uniref:Protein BZZ1 n=1 Tax=Friedmanniomyces endolithicus TaxID=329885 RepID=A0AAN6F930_9PEZI|nr:Protein BZZ1 [Friedmanniomyces endolithicus]KAK0288472.1 Protein BZZ1 [Friedmanniomyces endolithicus]KAK0306921.1 Protein BZZ1 [Friedmanniomyces endolithicus]KAK1006228.1 Protein BZZ1 [Friedmanniomyces endolithicus]